MLGKKVIEERAKIRGDFVDQAAVSQHLKMMFRDKIGWGRASDTQREALDNIANKLARIMTGDPAEEENWLDISGYCELVLKQLKGE